MKDNDFLGIFVDSDAERRKLYCLFIVPTSKRKHAKKIKKRYPLEFLPQTSYVVLNNPGRNRCRNNS